MSNELKVFTKDIADAIREKEESTELINPQDFGSRIRGIQTKENLDTELNEQDALLADLQSSVDELPNALDLSDASATSNDILEGKTAYVAEGKVTGTYKDIMQIKIDESPGYEGFYMFYMYKGNDISFIKNLDFSRLTNAERMFMSCWNITSLPAIDTSKVTKFDSMLYACKALKTVELIDMISATSAKSMLYDTRLSNLTLKNIKISLQLGGTNYSTQYTVESLLNTIKELHTNTGTSTLTLTLGTANTAKLANIYVKLIPITDEMRAEDEYIDNKAPFVQCESTDDGAMLITEYVTTIKKWTLA